MKKFMILFLAPMSWGEQMKVSPEEMKKGMELWNTWFRKIGDVFVDKGAPLENGLRFTKDKVSDEVIEVIGYSIVQADNMESIKGMLVDHPHFLTANASIEVFELMPMM